jgi:hypothetical protein
MKRPNMIGSDGKLTPIPIEVSARFIDSGVISIDKNTNEVISKMLNNRTNKTAGVARAKMDPLKIEKVQNHAYIATKK